MVLIFIHLLFRIYFGKNGNPLRTQKGVHLLINYEVFIIFLFFIRIIVKKKELFVGKEKLFVYFSFSFIFLFGIEIQKHKKLCFRFSLCFTFGVAQWLFNGCFGM